MRTATFIRHAESAANAGHTTDMPATITLTPRGHDQAQRIAAQFVQPPDVIVVSPYLRTVQTAQPLRDRFPHVPCEIWPVQEFTYLEPTRCANTNVHQRAPWIAAYWQRADPAFCDGPGAESLLQLFDRVTDCKARIERHRATQIAIFCHGQFMQALRYLVQARPPMIDADAMRAFRKVLLSKPLANGARLEARIAGPGEWVVCGR